MIIQNGNTDKSPSLVMQLIHSNIYRLDRTTLLMCMIKLFKEANLLPVRDILNNKMDYVGQVSYTTVLVRQIFGMKENK